MALSRLLLKLLDKLDFSKVRKKPNVFKEIQGRKTQDLVRKHKEW